jgi:hypothetical protein
MDSASISNTCRSKVFPYLNQSDDKPQTRKVPNLDQKSIRSPKQTLQNKWHIRFTPNQFSDKWKW